MKSTCTICKETKDASEFNKDSGKANGLHSYCKKCRKKDDRDRSMKMKQKYIDYKKTLSCKKCGENRHYVLEFHHLDPSKKEFTIGAAMASGRINFEKAKEEIDKCVVLCANCHREVHYLERN